MTVHPYSRPRRLRKSAAIRSLVKENQILVTDFIVPLFFMEGEKKKEEISSMPGYFRYTLDLLLEEVADCHELGLRSVLLFAKIPANLKDVNGSEALNPNGLMQRAVKAIKKNYPEMHVITDVALDPYSSSGHDGFVENGEIINDESVEILAQMALSHAQAGADMVGYVDKSAYTFEESKSIIGETFCGLPLDEDSESDLTDSRLESWASQLKGEISALA